MRSFIIGLLNVCICMHTAIAQQRVVVPQPVKAAFAKAYSSAQKVKWNQEGNDYEASFLYRKHTLSVLYADNGSLIETETAIGVEDLPKPARDYAQGRGTIAEAAKIVKADGTLQYEAEVKKRDLFFDDKGAFVIEKKDKD